MGSDPKRAAGPGVRGLKLPPHNYPRARGTTRHLEPTRLEHSLETDHRFASQLGSFREWKTLYRSGAVRRRNLDRFIEERAADTESAAIAPDVETGHHP